MWSEEKGALLVHEADQSIEMQTYKENKQNKLERKTTTMPAELTLSNFVRQLLSHGMGDLMLAVFDSLQFTFFSIWYSSAAYAHVSSMTKPWDTIEYRQSLSHKRTGKRHDM